MRLRSGRKRLENRGCRTYILYLWHPKFEKALESSGFDLRLYHIDDEYSFSSEPLPPDEREVRVIRSVDQVFAISPGLLERKGGINPRTDFAPEGVEYALYATPIDEPSDLARVPHPRIGYTGVLKKQLDWPLLRDLSLRHPEWSFVFVGPLNPHPEFHGIFQEMQGLPNVHFLGAKTVKDLASYPQHFDVCIMPYHVNWYTDNIYPLKLHEYLAGGRPVVGSPIRSLRDFQGVISLASTPEEWSQAIRYALSGEANTPAVRSSRQSMARRYDWNRLVHGIARTICARLGPGYEDRLTQI
jgi:glycosyltransferase involved in cell wall biosynthesis